MISKPFVSIVMLGALAACGQQSQSTEPVEAVAAAPAVPMPPLPEWVVPLVGQQLSTAFPTVAEKCIGNVDAIKERYSADTPGVMLSGWAWDSVGKKAFSKVVVVDEAGAIQGGASVDLPRADVAAARKDVTTATTGFSALVKLAAGQPQVYGIDEAAKSSCMVAVSPAL